MIKKSGTKVSLENIENKNEEDENEYSIKIYSSCIFTFFIKLGSMNI